jgi:hypothetical protein
MTNRGSKTDFLFAQPSFLNGIARALDIGGTFDAYNRSADEASADLRAISSDWKVIGQDMKRAIDSVKDEAA